MLISALHCLEDGDLGSRKKAALQPRSGLRTPDHSALTGWWSEKRAYGEPSGLHGHWIGEDEDVWSLCWPSLRLGSPVVGIHGL